jgi:aldose sugar dehydrogenase
LSRDSRQDNAAASARSPLLLLAGLTLLGAISVITLSGARLKSPVWELESKALWMMLLIAATYIATVAALEVGKRAGRPATLVQLLLVGAAATAPLFAASVFYFAEFTRTPLVVGPVLGLSLAWITVSGQRNTGLRVLIFSLLAAAGISVQFAIAHKVFAKAPQPKLVVKRLDSALYVVNAASFENYIPRPETNQGGISAFADGFVVATGDGDVYLYRRGSDGSSMQVQAIPAHVPINSADFKAAAAGTSVNLAFFRVADVLAQESSDHFRLFVSHHFWKKSEKCWVMRVSSLEGRYADFTAKADPKKLTWTTLYETKPCVPLATELRPAKFEGLFDGGRLVLLDDQHLLFSVGDHAMEGFGFDVAAAQDPDGSYGKIMLIDLKDGSSSIYASGLRNPEGMHLAPDGTLWESEHGPRGGDELNRIERGHNYGWPLVTYGVEYGTHGWPLAKKPGSHDGFDEPFLSWYPSIGPSNMIQVTSPLFPDWKDDLLLTTLAGQSLFRIRIRDNRVVFTERIVVDERIRDIVQAKNGEIVLWTDRETLVFLKPETASSAKSGEALYEACVGCHVRSDPSIPSVGPTLKGIVGRKVASVPDYEYSSALRALGGEWTPERLDAFLRNPAAYANGTKMAFAGIVDDGSRASLVKFLTAPKSRLEIAPPRAGVD